jgi:hypothetical protein
MENPLPYRSFLMRIGREAGEGAGVSPGRWFFDVVYIQTDEKQRFDSLQELLIYLCDQVEEMALDQKPYAKLIDMEIIK